MVAKEKGKFLQMTISKKEIYSSKCFIVRCAICGKENESTYHLFLQQNFGLRDDLFKVFLVVRFLCQGYTAHGDVAQQE